MWKPTQSNIDWSTSLWGLGGVDTEPMLTSVLSSNVAGIVMFSSTTRAGASSFGFLGGRPGLRPDFGCKANWNDVSIMQLCGNISPVQFSSNICDLHFLTAKGSHRSATILQARQNYNVFSLWQNCTDVAKDCRTMRKSSSNWRLHIHLNPQAINEFLFVTTWPLYENFTRIRNAYIIYFYSLYCLFYWLSM